MKAQALKILLTAALLGQAAALCAGQFRQVSIYGNDDRVDYYQADEVMKKLAGSTAAMFKDSDIPLDEASGRYALRKLTLKEKYNLQAGEKFEGQPVGAFCSGALVGEDLVLTSGHCFQPDSRGGPCGRIKFVFGYAVTGQGKTPSDFSADDVFSCSKVTYQRVQDDVSSFACKGASCRQGTPGNLGPDWALVKLDRKVKGRYPLAVSRQALNRGAKLAAIGYPSGLPVKVASDGKVRTVVSTAGYFVTDLDTFGGNSGAPVFNLATYRIEGVLSRGGVDYMYDNSGSEVADPEGSPYYYKPGKAKVYSQEGGRGEDVTLASEFEALIPKTEMEKYLDESRPQGGQQKALPAVHVPGTNGQVVPAVYYAPPPPPPEPTWI
jgi:V8-like Glu-specific endopeptidase